MAKKNLGAAKEAIDKFLSHAATEYQRFKSDREAQEVDNDAKVADAMLRCARNSEVSALESAAATGQPDTEVPSADVGSIRYLRLVNQKNAQMDGVLHAAELPFSFTPISNPEVFRSAQEASDQAAVHNTLAKYTWSKDSMPEKLYECGVEWFAKGYCAFMMIWNMEKRRVKIYDHKTKKTAWKEVTSHVYPSVIPLGFDNVYADFLGGPIKDQLTVIVLTQTTWPKIQMAKKSKWYDAKVVDEMYKERAKYKWDGSEGGQHIIEQSVNDGKNAPNVGESDQVLQWDVYSFVPIKGTEWDDENEYNLHWMTVLGNSLSAEAGRVVRLEDDFDPDGEIPVYMGNVLPDNKARLYHRTYAQAVRPLYAVECTLWNLTIDNNHGVNEPPVAFDSSQFNKKPTSFRFCRGNKWDIRNPRESVVEFPVRSTLVENIRLIESLQTQQETAFASNQNQMGEGFGGRMAATENINISRQSQLPNVAELRYVIGGFLRWYAPKVKSMWQGFASPELIKAIADEELTHPVYVDQVKEGEEKFPAGMPIYGDFDVELTVLDEYIEDFVQSQQELALLQTVATNQVLQQSKTHRVDMGFWMRDFFRRRRIRNADRIIIPAGESDAQLRQRDELRSMQDNNLPLPINEGEDHAAHIGECEAEIMRLKPLLSLDDKELDEGQQATKSWADVYITQLVIPHMELHKRAAAAQQAQTQSAGTPAAPGPETPGQAAGGVPAALLGEALGG